MHEIGLIKRHQSRRVPAVEAAEESSFAKELAKLNVRVNQMDTLRREDVNYVQQGGGPNRPFNNNNYRPNQGGGNYNNFNGNRSHPNLSYSNNNFIQPPA